MWRLRKYSIRRWVLRGIICGCAGATHQSHQRYQHQCFLHIKSLYRFSGIVGQLKGYNSKQCQTGKSLNLVYTVSQYPLTPPCILPRVVCWPVALYTEVSPMSVTDHAQEVSHLQAELARLDDEINRIANKLNNAGFITRVPAALIEKEQKKMAGFQKLQAQIQQKISQANSD
ncbi:hypothetical protein GAY96_05575 [Venatoribacter cucullus]|nr:hypothetical protein GAY96_05575 [Venatoribacter cucullus]